MTPIDLTPLRHHNTIIHGELFDSNDPSVLLEDLIEIELPSNKFIDLGWYPEHNLKGNYTIRLWSRNNPRADQLFHTNDHNHALLIIQQLLKQNTVPTPDNAD